MTLWKTEHFENFSGRQVSNSYLDIIALAALAVAPGVLFVWLFPLPFLPPVICVVSFLMACAFAWFAHYTSANKRSAEISAWDVAGIFTLVWVGAGLASDHTHFIRLLELLAKG